MQQKVFLNSQVEPPFELEKHQQPFYACGCLIRAKETLLTSGHW